MPVATVPAWIRFEVLRIGRSLFRYFANVRFCSRSACIFLFARFPAVAGTFTFLVAVDENSGTRFRVHQRCEYHFRLHAESTITGSRQGSNLSGRLLTGAIAPTLKSYTRGHVAESSLPRQMNTASLLSRISQGSISTEPAALLTFSPRQATRFCSWKPVRPCDIARRPNPCHPCRCGSQR